MEVGSKKILSTTRTHVGWSLPSRVSSQLARRARASHVAIQAETQHTLTTNSHNQQFTWNRPLSADLVAALSNTAVVSLDTFNRLSNRSTYSKPPTNLGSSSGDILYPTAPENSNDVIHRSDVTHFHSGATCAELLPCALAPRQVSQSMTKSNMPTRETYLGRTTLPQCNKEHRHNFRQKPQQDHPPRKTESG